MTEQKMRGAIAEQMVRKRRANPKQEFEIIQIFQTKWHSRVLFELIEKAPRRFGELKREVPGISNGVLANVLRSLEDKGLVTRKQFQEIPPHVEYALTERSERMLPIFYEMIRWEAECCPESFR